MVSVPVSDPFAPAYRAPAGAGLDGVVRIGTGTNYGTGTLLAGGRHVLTAAHLVEGAAVSALSVRFDLPDGPVTVAVAARHLHPGFGAPNADLAILELAAPAPAAAGRVELYRDADEAGRTVTIAGYGAPATGISGETGATDSLTRRFGLNTVDIPTHELVNIGGLGWTVQPPGSQLALDFDDGTAARDALGLFAGVPHLGLADREAMPSKGDSGGPWLIDGRLAGVSSYLFRLASATAQPDVTGRQDSSFGEIASAQRVSHFAEWIDKTVRSGFTDAPARPDQVAKEVTEGGAGSTRLAYFLVELSQPGPGGGSVEFRTVDGTAKAGEDYIAAAGRLVLHPGETRAVVPVEIIGDAAAEGSETFFLEVSGPRGGSLAAGAPVLRATRTILDDDGPRSLPAPPDSAPLVPDLYHAVLGREPDAGGLAYWTRHLEQGLTPEGLRDALAGSPEGRAKAALIGAGLIEAGLRDGLWEL